MDATASASAHRIETNIGSGLSLQPRCGSTGGGGGLRRSWTWMRGSTAAPFLTLRIHAESSLLSISRAIFQAPRGSRFTIKTDFPLLLIGFPPAFGVAVSV